VSLDTNDSSSSNRAYLQAAAQTFLSQIEPVFPGLTAKYTGKATLSVWHKNPHALGAYAYWQIRTYAHTNGPQLVAPSHFIFGMSYALH